ncbi:hypothetical protein N0V91_011397, partial [Didymella pomorum]
VAVVGVPAPSTITVTSGGVGYTSTVPTTINGVATQVAVVVQPQTPFHVYITDFGGNVYGYLDMNSNPVSASTYNSTTTDFASSSLYYLDAATGQLANVNFNLATGTGFLYGTPRILAQESIVYSGYFRVPTSGTYSLTFPLSTVDDVAYVWMGRTVTDGTWGESNWNLRGTYGVLRPATPTISQFFVAGSLYPIRILYGNAPGGAVLQLNIVNPAGTTITDTTGYFVQPSCANSGSPLGSTTAIDITTCSATGIEWSMRTNLAVGGSTPISPNYPTFDPGLYNGATSPVTLAGGITGNIQVGIASPGIAATIYNQGPYDLTQKAFIYRGYFAANVTGSWTFTYSNPDDVAYMWFGGTAISTWTKTNANLVGSLNGNVATYTVGLTAGTLYPIRMVLGNSAGAVSFTLQTLDPLGTTRTGTAGFFRQIHCGTDFGWT